MADQTKKSRNAWSVAVIGLKLLLICAIVAGVVSGVYKLTNDKYQDNVRIQKEEAIQSIFGEGISYAVALEAEAATVYRVTKDNALIGYCVETATMGFGEINLSVGYLPDGSIKRVCIVPPLNETPGIGSKIQEDPSHLPQYDGKSGELTIGEDIDAISGATISSKAVLTGVNQATRALEQVLGGAAG